MCSGTRITPAHAGKTDFRPQRKPLHPDHPRACGENVSIGDLTSNFIGSPPRMRGKQKPSDDIWAQIRITPAHAGKTDKVCNDKNAYVRITPAHAGKTNKMVHAL